MEFVAHGHGVIGYGLDIVEGSCLLCGRYKVGDTLDPKVCARFGCERMGNV